MKKLAHMLAFLTAVIWGITFISSKVLLLHGMPAATIFFYRIALAYIVLATFMRIRGNVKWTTESVRDELMMIVLGISGGSAYFLFENLSLDHTATTNSSIIVSASPLFVAVLVSALRIGERLSRIQIAGSVLSLLGMALVIINGSFVLHMSPLGDILALGACLCWAVYSLVMIVDTKRYDTFFITRKVFFYGMLTILPWIILTGDSMACDLLTIPVVMWNLLFLGLIASAVCFLCWAWCIKQLGAVVATNWVYFSPVATIVAAALVLNEEITLCFIIGCAMIITGMYIADRKPKVPHVRVNWFKVTPRK